MINIQFSEKTVKVIETKKALPFRKVLLSNKL